MYSHSNNLFLNELEPSEFYLSPTYPNPFREKTTIKYCVAYKSRVQLTVYSSEGEEIEKLVNEIKKPGTYEIEFNANALPSGVYSYQLKASDYVETKKMILIK